MSTKTAAECERIARRWNVHLENIGARVYGASLLRRRDLTGRDVATMLADVVISCLENDVGALNNLVGVAKSDGHPQGEYCACTTCVARRQRGHV